MRYGWNIKDKDKLFCIYEEGEGALFIRSVVGGTDGWTGTGLLDHVGSYSINLFSEKKMFDIRTIDCFERTYEGIMPNVAGISDI